ncbi:MAG: hypothetical protein L6416_11220 [Candidatus Omnitrophica bacterium]|nr:hypothetical protein [Candidatus Omnitrophota bacterium]
MKQAQSIGLLDPQFEKTYYEKRPVVEQTFCDWQTPGVCIAEEIKGYPKVRFVGEKMQADYMQTIVVLDDDPEDLLDKIFSTEQKMYKDFENLRFDLRVRVISKNENIDVIKKNTMIYYDREILELCSDG